VKKFIITFVLSFITFWLLEHAISYLFDLDNLQIGWLGWLGIMIVYGFKYHILCCLVPLIWTTYKCKHKKCRHDHCSKNNII